MRDVCEPFRGKKITLMGLGLLGRGVGDAEFLAECEAEVLVTDMKTEEQLKDTVQRLKKYPNISFRLGGHDENDFTNRNIVIKAAGVPLNSPYIAAAKAAEVPVYMSTALFAKYAAEAGAIIVGITGTRGKSTVSTMIYHNLKRIGRRVHLGGNIRGKSTLAMLPEVKRSDVIVLELDSWQLQGFGDLEISPHIAVFTNLMPDHLNYYKSMDEYFSDKANMFRFQKPGDVLIAGRSIADRIRAESPALDPIIPERISSTWKLQIPGEHNRENASFAAAALEALGLTDGEVRSGLESFEPIEGRLQFLREVNGVKIYNDNHASTPEATIAALRALKELGHLTLIAGGTDKDVQLEGLAHEIDSSVRSLVLFSGTGTERLKPLLHITYTETDSLEHALRRALKATPPGGIVLFSPAFASFGPFVNYYERNDQFLRIVEKLE